MFKGYDFYHPSVRAEYDAKHGYWILCRGIETFYDENNVLRVWDAKEKALAWVRANYPQYRIIDGDIDEKIEI